MRRKKEEAALGGGDGRLTPMDVQQVEFRLSFRGYNERDVDAFLDRITEDLNAYLEENDRLRVSPAATQAGSDSDLVGVARAEAEEIVARAREQAASILREAEATRFASPAGSPIDARSALAPFLGREREFLQGLGTLVQSHAEEIKGMVMALRAKTEAVSSAETPAEEPAREDAVPEDRSDAGTVSLPEAIDQEEATTAAEEPAPPMDEGAVDTMASEPASARRDSGERSLRDLFWGED